ncbi:MAG TPA: hypothetical protein VK024_08815 [Actinomycetaceae bacterium]|nr:hypothetical protein [Actinomycetaceae bacterium]
MEERRAITGLQRRPHAALQRRAIAALQRDRTPPYSAGPKRRR